MGKNKLIIIDADKNRAPLLNNFYIDSAYAAIDKLSYEYPNFGKWYYEKIVPGLFSGERKILVNLIDNTVSAVAILKDTVEERKICTIRVHPLFRRQGVGKMLIGKSFELLETDKPIITVSSARMGQFRNILKYFGFKLEKKIKGIYIPHVTEYVFNGDLISTSHFSNVAGKEYRYIPFTSTIED